MKKEFQPLVQKQINLIQPVLRKLNLYTVSYGEGDFIASTVKLVDSPKESFGIHVIFEGNTPIKNEFWIS